MSKALEVTAQTFQAEVLDSPLPALVDLYATWCMPCVMMGKVLDQLASTLEGKAKIVKVNVDEQRELAAAFNVSSIPMLILFKDGKAVDHVVGAVPQRQVLAMVQKVLSVEARP